MASPGWDRLTLGLILGGAISAASCTSTAPSRLSPQELAALQGKSIAVQELPSAHFALMSSSSSIVAGTLLGPLGAGINAVKAEKAGDLIVEQDHLVDPVTVIAPALLADLGTTYAMKAAQLNRVASTNPGSAVAYTGADFVLSVEVPVWTTMYLPGHVDRYGVMLVARAKIVDAVSKKSLREARCVIRPRERPDAPTFNELTDNNGLRLRAELEYATHACIDAMRHSLIGE